MGVLPNWRGGRQALPGAGADVDPITDACATVLPRRCWTPGSRFLAGVCMLVLAVMSVPAASRRKRLLVSVVFLVGAYLLWVQVNRAQLAQGAVAAQLRRIERNVSRTSQVPQDALAIVDRGGQFLRTRQTLHHAVATASTVNTNAAFDLLTREVIRNDAAVIREKLLNALSGEERPSSRPASMPSSGAITTGGRTRP
jgi:hypothetical protein